MGTLFTFIVVAAIIGFLIYNSNQTKHREISLLDERRQQAEQYRQQLYDTYQAAIQSGDKAEALKAGRAYHSYLRNGELTLYDEQAIANDLSTMK